MEQRVKTASDGVLNSINKGRESVGERPFDQQKIPPLERARKYLPVWLVFANAADEVAIPWTEGMLQKKGWGPKALAAWDRDCRKLFESSKAYALEAVLSMTDEQRSFYNYLISVGLHAGRPRPTEEEMGKTAQSRTPRAVNMPLHELMGTIGG
jgi:hypothetical protein